MFNGIKIATTGCLALDWRDGNMRPCGNDLTGGVLQTGAMHLRAATASNLRNNLANGNYLALANTLYTLNYSKAGGINPTLPAIPAGVNGAVLRRNNFPENFIEPIRSSTTATLQTNLGNTNYHSMQAEVTLRPTGGVSTFRPPTPGASFSAEPAVHKPCGPRRRLHTPGRRPSA